MSNCKDCGACQEAAKPYRTSELYNGEYYPVIQVHTLNLPSTTSTLLRSVSPVKRNLVVSIEEGQAHIWFINGSSGKPFVGGETPHLNVGIQPEPFVLPLPPGAVDIVVGAGGGIDLEAAVTFIDAEAR